MSKTYRADQVGSLLRPTNLLEARSRREQGLITQEGLTQAEDEAILEALAMQRQTGVSVVTDGEYRRMEFRSVFADAVSGMAEIPAPEQAGQPLGSVSPGMVITSKVEAQRRLTAQESSFLLRNAGAPVKVAVPSVSQIVSSYWQRGASEQAYPTTSSLYPEIAAILRAEIEALIAEGVSYVQIDAPRYTYFVDDNWRQRFRDAGDDPDVIIDQWIAADNTSYSGVDTGDATLAMHLCRGNNRGGWFGEGSYAPIAEKLFNNIAVDTFLLEFDSDRSGGFEPLRFVPRNKHVVLGLVTTKTGDVETVDDLLRRVEEAAQYVDMENLSISPQCGFATFFSGNPLSWDQQRQKLEVVAETARRAWG